MTIEVVRDERLRLVARLQRLSPSDWDRPSLCAGWTVRHVLGHLITPFEVSAPRMAFAIARHRGIDRAMDVKARRLAAAAEPDDLLRTLEANASSTFRPPGMPLTAPLTDVVAHSADIRWALGDPVEDWAVPSRLLPVLDFLTGSRSGAGLLPTGRPRGVQLVADDQDWTWGEGDPVRGASLTLVMAMFGRAAALPHLDGAGVARLAP